MMHSPAINQVSTMFNQAIRLHQSGRLTEAARAYQQVLAFAPGHADSLHLLGVIANQRQRPDLAIQMIEQAIASDNRQARYHCELGVALQQTGRRKQAARSFRKSIAVDPAHAYAWFCLGNLLLDDQKTAEAINHFEKAVSLSPDQAEFLFNLGTAYQSAGRLADAENNYRSALESQPGFIQAFINLGSLLSLSTRWEEAAEVYRRALSVDTGNTMALRGLATALRGMNVSHQAADVLNRLGSRLIQEGAYREAAQNLEEALAYAPDAPDVHYNLGVALLRLGQLERAQIELETVIDSRPDFADAHNNLGLIHREMGDTQKALTYFERAVGLDSPHAHINMGNLFTQAGDHDKAKLAYRRAIELQSDNSGAYLNLANEELLTGNATASEEILRTAVSLKADSPASQANLAMAHTNLAVMLLARGDFREGWQEYQWRDGGPVDDPFTADGKLAPIATLSSAALRGKRLVLIPDQGLGDEIFFLRFAAIARKHGALITAYASPKIHGLLARCCDFEVRNTDDKIVRKPQNDLILRVGDLPLLLGAEHIADIPPPLPLFTQTERLDEMQLRLRALGHTSVLGITWQAGTTHTGALQKSIPLNLLLDALQDWTGGIVILQRNPVRADIEKIRQTLGPDRVADFSDLNEDLEGMLALLHLLDDYVGVSNTNMHLRASLDRSARVLMPFPADWRWMAQGDTSAWLPRMSIYRQSDELDWGPCLQRLRADLSGH